MPRINRNAVTFPGPDGKTWVARFSHEHDEAKGIQHIARLRNSKGRMGLVPVKHITYCKLGHLDDTSRYLMGTAACSMQDEYDWRYGIRWALISALEKGRFCKTSRSELGLHVVEPLKAEFGFIMGAFYHELPIKAYGPEWEAKQAAMRAQPPVLEGELINATPVENLAGTYHAGAD